MNDVRIETPGMCFANFFEHFQERVTARAALHPRENAAAGVLERHVEIFRQARMRRNGFEQARRDAIRVAVEKTNPVQVFDLREALEKSRQAVADAEIFAVKRGVLADQGNFADARGGEIFRFAHDRFESAAAEFSAKLRDHAERAGMVAALVDFDVGRVARRGENARRQVVIKICGKFGVAAASPARELAFAGCEDFLDFAGADDGVHFGNLLADFVAVALDHAAGDDQFLARGRISCIRPFRGWSARIPAAPAR